ncbi:MAG: hypothetical protein Q4F10_06180 [Corynebacterium glutamicum]|nr:hypothetical protein [Corynebacterium glutamicum]
MATRPIPPLLADGGDMTVMRFVASHAFGKISVTLPDGVETEESDLDQAYSYKLRAGEVPPFGRRFIRADLDIDAENITSTVEDVLDDVTNRTAGEALFQRDFTRAALGRLELGVDFNVGDLVPVRRWGRILENQLVTAADDLSTPDDPFGVRIHVGGQLIREPAPLAQKNRDIAREIAQERKERLAQVKAVDQKATDAKSTADAAKAESAAAKLAADKAITENTVQYAVGDSAETAPENGWSSSTPVRQPGEFVWFRAVVTYGDGQTKTTAPALLTGDAGAPGGTTYLHVAYATSADGSSGFSTTDPAGKTYIGTYTDFVEADSTDHTKYAWVLIKGADGDPGIGVKSTVVEYQESASGTASPSGVWSADVPAVAAGRFLWTRVTQTMDDGAQTISYSVARQGADGDDGRSVTSTTMHYAQSSSGTEIPAANQWTTSPPEPVQGKYNWVRTTWGYSDSTVSVGYSVSYLGTDGEPGNGVADAVITYQISQSGVTPPTGAWMEEIPALSEGDWLWTRTIWTLDDGQAKTAYSVAHVGEDGKPGDEGVGIVAVVPWWRYQLKTDDAPETPEGEIPAGWVNVEPEYLPNRYLWQTLQVEFSNGEYSFSAPSRVASFLAADAAVEKANAINEALTGTIDGDLSEALGDSSTAIGEVAAAAKRADDWTVENQQAFNEAVALSEAAQEQVNDVNEIAWQTQAERNALQAEIDEAQNTTARLAFPHLSITPADSDGRPYWSYGGARTSNTPDGSYVTGDPSTFSWVIDSVFPGSTVDDAYFYVTPNIDLKVGHSSYKWNIAGTSTIGVAYIGFVDEAGDNAVEAWKDGSTTTGEWFTTSEASAPTVKSEWMSGNHVFRIKPGVTKVRPTVRVLERTSINGLDISAWFPVREDLDKMQFDFQESMANRVRPLETTSRDHEQRLEVLEAGETWRHLGARRGRLVRDTGYVNISWPSDKRATVNWAAGQNFDVIFRINYENNTVIEDAFNTLDDFPGEWGATLGNDSGTTNIRSASASYFRKPGVGHTLTQNVASQIIPASTWYTPANTAGGAFGWNATYAGKHRVSMQVDWAAATYDYEYSIAVFVNGVNRKDLVQRGLGPIKFWHDGRRTQTLEWEGNLAVGDQVRLRIRSTSNPTTTDASQRRMSATGSIFWIEK